ncbi:MFS transporter [Mariprofundus sp. KV]|uniref:MFS transporter n=1 Tax=Mariprofundus sp. KV TaxID=2608715 RepID=UPI0015A36720|nr:MFS transporter [Mariprofundus sp. KV]NWF36870.1 MFS transporter [Mariprofundus sp. KV]
MNREADTSPEGGAAQATGRLPVKTKLGWGVGGFGENIANSAILSLVFPIFNVALGFSTLAIGLAMAISRIADAILDPIIGNLTDNSESRWGRRRPWMFVGSILMSLFFSAVWFLPTLMPQLPKLVTIHLTQTAETHNQASAKQLHDSLSWYGVSAKDVRLTPEQASGSFNIILHRAPESATAFSVEQVANSDHPLALTISPAQLTFTPENWMQPQTVTVSASIPEAAEFTTGLRILPSSDVLHAPLLHRFGISSQSSLQMFGAFALLCLLFYFSFSVFVIPYSGLGIELTDDYAERTNLQIYRLVASFCASLLVGYLYLWSQMAGAWLGGDEVLGVRVVGLCIGLLVLISTMLPAILCRERFAAIERKKEHLSLLMAIKLTAVNRSFRMLMGSVFAVFMGLFFSLPFMTYIGIYYVCQGDKMLAAEIGGVMTIVQVTGQFLAMPLISWASERVDKKVILFAGLSVSIIGYASSWWLFTPENPWLQIIPVVVAAWGLCACWAVNGSFAADICDEDELNTGHRREGVYSAVFALVYKSAIGIVALGSGALLAWAGVAGQETMLPADTLLTVRIAYLAIPVGFLSLAIISMWYYPLTRERVGEIQSQLRPAK